MRIFLPASGNRIDLHIYDGTNKAKLALYEMNLIWLHGVKYCYALELNKIGSLFASRSIFWIPVSSTRRCRNSSSRRNWRAKGRHGSEDDRTSEYAGIKQ